MVGSVQGFQALARHVGVNLRGRQAGVPQQQLHHAQVSTMVDQVGGKGVAQRVRAKRRDARLFAIAGNQVPGHLSCHRLLAVADKQVLAARCAHDQWPAFRQIATQPVFGHFAQWHQPLLVALADDAHIAFAQIQLAQRRGACKRAEGSSSRSFCWHR